LDAADPLTIRPLRPADRERVLEIVADVWDGHDYLPQVLDDWLADPAGNLQAGELDGVVVAVHRWRPIQRSIAYYEGMRVAKDHRRQGIGRAMLRAAIEEVRGLEGYEVLRLATGNPHARALFESEGFRHRLTVTHWQADRVEGGEPARMPPVADAARLHRMLSADPALAAYAGLDPLPDGPREVDVAYLEELLRGGHLREGAGGRAIALAGPYFGGRRLIASLVAGSGAALQDLLLALRYEADADGREGVGILAPRDHPAEKDFLAVGYDQPDRGWEFSILDLTL
jgi:GNAT superfamily N-acetyltransferase